MVNKGTYLDQYHQNFVILVKILIHYKYKAVEESKEWLKLIKKTQKKSACNPLYLETLGSWPILPKMSVESRLVVDWYQEVSISKLFQFNIVFIESILHLNWKDKCQSTCTIPGLSDIHTKQNIGIDQCWTSTSIATNQKVTLLPHQPKAIAAREILVWTNLGLVFRSYAGVIWLIFFVRPLCSIDV